MKRFRTTAPLILGALLAGCELETEAPQPPDQQPADHVVINEVFTLPLTNPTPYYWIEFFNPTGDTVDLTNWTLTYSTARVRQTYTGIVDTSGGFTFISATFVPDSFGVFDVPFAEGIFDNPFEEEDTVRLPPGGLFTIVSDEDRLLDHINWGPGDERFRREREVFQGPLESFTVIDSTDSTMLVQATANAYVFYFQPTEQLILRDPDGNVVDVVRYGNYVYSGPSSNDPFPGNTSAGIIPEFETIQRYANAYHTNNTANDFYLSRSDLVPTPQWYSQLYKR
jgi:hypothetical protein